MKIINRFFVFQRENLVNGKFLFYFEFEVNEGDFEFEVFNGQGQCVGIGVNVYIVLQCSFNGRDIGIIGNFSIRGRYFIVGIIGQGWQVRSDVFCIVRIYSF